MGNKPKQPEGPAPDWKKINVDGPIVIDADLHIKLISSTCGLCRNLLDPIERKCRAFDEIPLEIWNSIGGHREPHEGDGGIMFEPGPREGDHSKEVR